MRRLIVKLSSIGDVVHTVPAVRMIRAAFPADTLAWIVEEPAAPIVEGSGLVDEIFVLPRRRWRGAWGRASTWREAAALFRPIRAQRFDQAIDFQGLARSAAVSVLLGARERVGFRRGREGSPLVYTERIATPGGPVHAIDRYRMLAEAVGGDPAAFDPRIPVPPAAAERAGDIIRGEGLGRDFIAIHPSAGRLTNRYPTERLAVVADRARDELGLRVAITGSAADAPLAARLLGEMRGEAVDLTGRLGLWELAAFARASRLFLSGDTGPLHLAVSAGAEVVAIYSGADPRRTGPYGCSTRVIRGRHPCGPCYRRTCPDLPCMRSIDPGDVVDRIAAIVSGAEIDGAPEMGAEDGEEGA